MVGAESGFDFERYDDIRGQRRILEANGGGAAIFDFDGDGLPDVFLTNGCRLPRKPGDRDTPSELYRQQGGMQFERVARLARLEQFGFANGCAVGDVDADGFDDLYVTAYGRDALWHNNGDGTFSDVTASANIDSPDWSSSAAFADLNGDGHLDLFVVNYLVESDESPKLCPNPNSPDGYEQCTPAMFEGVDDVLYLSDGAGGFVDVTADAGLAGLRGKGLGVVIADLDLDGRLEIYVANDGEANFLLVPVEPAANARVRFAERGLSSGVALSESGYAQASMGIAAGDYDANGTLDLFVTNFFGDTNTLYANRGGLGFDDATRSGNLGAPSRNKLGFGTVFFDPDNDGRLDLLVANGHVDDRTWMSHGEPYRMRPSLYRSERNGTFSDVSDWAGDYFHKEWLGRGLAVGDLDRDGRLDAVVSHQLAPSVVLRNETETDNTAISLRLVGTVSNRNGYGARVEIVGSHPKVVRELVGGASFQSASLLELHLGLGSRATAAVQIQWPSGQMDTYRDVSAGRWIAIEGVELRSQTGPGIHTRAHEKISEKKRP